MLWCLQGTGGSFQVLDGLVGDGAQVLLVLVGFLLVVATSLKVLQKHQHLQVAQKGCILIYHFHDERGMFQSTCTVS